MKCKKCNGTKVIRLDHNHNTVCDACCKHDKGWWPLTKNHVGYFKGAMCCTAGCGKTIKAGEYRRVKIQQGS